MTGLGGTVTNANINIAGNITTKGQTPDAPPNPKFPINTPAFKVNGGGVYMLSSGDISVGNINTGDVGSANPAIAAHAANSAPVILVAGSGSTAGAISFGSISAVGTLAGYLGNGVQIVSVGTSGSGTIAGTSITTDTYLTGSVGGSVVVSSATGSINITNISTQGQAVSSYGGDVLLSSGALAGSSVSANINANASAIFGQVYVFTYNTASAASVSSTQSNGLNAAAPAFIQIDPLTVSALPTGTNTLQFVPGNGSVAVPQPASVLAFDSGAAPEPIFFNPGGYTAINDSGSPIHLTVAAGLNNLAIPFIVRGNASIILTNASSALLVNDPTTFIGNGININNTVNAVANNRTLAAISRDNISISNSQVQDFSMGSMVTPKSLTQSVTGAMVLEGNTIARSVDQTVTGVVGHAGRLTSDSVLVVTQDLTFSTTDYTTGQISTTTAGTQFSPYMITAGADSLNVHDLSATYINLGVMGTAMLTNVTTSSVLNNGLSSLSLNTYATANNQGSIILNGTINTPQGSMLFASAGSILTRGLTDITALGNTGVLTAPLNGNYVYMLAGVQYIHYANVLIVAGRSGIGGDIIMPGLDQIIVTTDRPNGLGGDIVLSAYSDTIKGLRAGRVLLPDFVPIVVTSPNLTSPNSLQPGVIIIAEASGGPTDPVTLKVGEIDAGIGSIQLSTSTPNINLPTGSNVPVQISDANGFLLGGVFAGGTVQSHASLNAQLLSADGVVSLQKISVIAGANLTTGNIIAVGGVGFPIPNSLNGFTGGPGAQVILSGHDAVVINGNIWTFGGGGGGGAGDPYTTGLGQLGGGAGATGGPGGSVSVTSTAGSIFIDGDINTSGGGGGGGGGGFAGTGTSAGSTNGGAGGQGGSAGYVKLQAIGLSSSATVTVTGTVLAVGGGNGGAGGAGDPTTGTGGGGGGGGASFGGGGGGGGGGISQPQGTNFTGYGGAGGAGFLGGGGGDIQNEQPSNPSVNYSGLGGWGGGSFLDGILGNGFGGGHNVDLFDVPRGQPGVGTSGGDGGVPPPLPIIPGAVGGIAEVGVFAHGGAGGISSSALANSIYAGSNGKDVGFGGFDGQIIIQGNGYTTPSLMWGGAIDLITRVGSTGSINIVGKQIASGSGIQFVPGFVTVPATFNVLDEGGNINIAPGTTINILRPYSQGSIYMQANNVATGTISIGAGSQVIGAGNMTFTIGALSPPVSRGKPPAGTKEFTLKGFSTALEMFYGGGGISSTGAGNLIGALGDTRLYFQTPVGHPKQITLGGGVNITSSVTSPVTSLDLTNGAIATGIVNLQQFSGGQRLFDGTLKFTQSAGIDTITGGNLILYPGSIAPNIKSLVVPQGVTVQFVNFGSLNPIDISISPSSTSQNITINGVLNFSTGTVAPNPAVTVHSNLNPSFTIGPKGSVVTPGNFSLLTPGDIVINGKVSAGKILTLATDAGSGGSITLAGTTVTGTKGVFLTADGLGVINLNLGTLSSSANITLIGESINFGLGKITATAGTLTMAPSLSAEDMSIGGIGPNDFNISSTNLLAIKAKTIQLGVSGNLGDIDVEIPLDVTKSTNGGVGIFGLSFVTGGDFSTNGNAINLGSHDLTVSANNATLDSITGGGKVNLTTNFGLTLNNGITGATSTQITTNAKTLVIPVGQTLNGKALTINLGTGGATNGISTNAPTVTVNGNAGTTVITDSAKSIALAGVTGFGLTLNAPTDKSKITLTKPINGSGNITLNASGLDSSILISANITDTAGAVTLSANGKGTITQSKPTFLLTAPSMVVNAGTRNIGASKTNPLNTVVVALIVTGTGQAFITDNEVAPAIVTANLAGITLNSTGSVSLVHGGSPLTLNPSSIAGDFVLTSNNTINILGLTTHGLTTASHVGDVVISTSSGAINVNGNITVTGGGIDLLTSDVSAAGNITFKAGVKVTTLTTIPTIGPASKPYADIRVGIGSLATTGPVGTLPGFTITNTGTGQVFAGNTPASIVGGTTKPALLNAINANLALNVNLGAAGKITVNNGTLIQADPAMGTGAPAAAATHAARLIVMPTATAAGAAAAIGNASPSAQTTNQAAPDAVRMLIPIDAHAIVPAMGARLMQTMRSENGSGESRSIQDNAGDELVVDTDADMDSDILVGEPLRAVGF